MKGFRAHTIIHKAQRELLNERVRQTNFTIDILRNKIDNFHSQLKDKLPQDLFDEVFKFVEKAQLTQHSCSKLRQQGKFARLQTPKQDQSRADTDTNWRKRKSNDDFQDKKDVWVKNLSDKTLDETETSVLAKGLNFAVTPRQQSLLSATTE